MCFFIDDSPKKVEMCALAILDDGNLPYGAHKIFFEPLGHKLMLFDGSRAYGQDPNARAQAIKKWEKQRKRSTNTWKGRRRNQVSILKTISESIYFSEIARFWKGVWPIIVQLQGLIGLLGVF